jgi:hypothetical protein
VAFAIDCGDMPTVARLDDRSPSNFDQRSGRGNLIGLSIQNGRLRRSRHANLVSLFAQRIEILTLKREQREEYNRLPAC